MAVPGPSRPRFDTASQFGPPAGFALPGGPRLPGGEGELETGLTFWLSIGAAVLFVPMGLPALVLVLQARRVDGLGQLELARGLTHAALGFAATGIVSGLAAWGVVVARLLA